MATKLVSWSWSKSVFTYVVLVSVDEIVTAPDEPVAIWTLVPAIKYEVPSWSFVSDPDKAGAVTMPENAEPDSVATIVLSIFNVTSPAIPPPDIPVPATTEVISPVDVPVIVIAPVEPEVICMLFPAIR